MKNLFLTNKLLIASPSLSDTPFARSVTYICEHNEKGAVGIMVNRPLDLSLDLAFSQMNINIPYSEIKNIPLLYGGPVQQDRGFVIHKPTGQWESTLKTNKDIAITTSKDILQAIALGQGPKEMLVALGYAGWEANQLEQEIKTNSWLICPLDSTILFSTPEDLRWQTALKTLGIDPIQLTHSYGHA